tara:strand:+ start:1304 stop:1903 length:600 start_codon:yes stop_codon:yes gene_type:complete
MNNSLLSTLTVLTLSLLFSSACEDDISNPKPPTFLKVEMSAHSYHLEESAAPFQMEISDLFTFKTSRNCDLTYCEQEIYLGREIDGNINLFYKKVDHIDSLGKLINFSNQEVDFHKIKADKIDYNQVIDKNKKVYGTLFELKGNVATNFQFYLTDSLQNFLRGEVILNCVPNYDSLKSTLNYIKVDLTHMINTFEWLNN